MTIQFQKSDPLILSILVPVTSTDAIDGGTLPLPSDIWMVEDEDHNIAKGVVAAAMRSN
jgi:hypothetical protein